MICYISAQQSYISIIKLINGEIHLRLRARGSALHHTITATGTLLISICISFTRHILLNFFMQSMTTKKLVILHHLNFLRLELFISRGLIASRRHSFLASLSTFNRYNFSWHISKTKNDYILNLYHGQAYPHPLHLLPNHLRRPSLLPWYQ